MCCRKLCADVRVLALADGSVRDGLAAPALGRVTRTCRERSAYAPYAASYAGQHAAQLLPGKQASQKPIVASPTLKLNAKKL